MKRFLYSTTLIVLALLAGNVGAQHKCPDDTAIFEGTASLKEGVYDIAWILNCETKEIEITINTQAQGWAAIGFGDATAPMVNMDNYQFAFDNSGNVIYYDRWATDYSEPTTDAVQNFIGTPTGVEEGGTRTFTFKRALDTGDAAQDAVLGGDTAHAVMWAYHATSDDISDYHSANKGTVSSDELDFFSTGSVIASSEFDWLHLHGFLMTIVWSVLFVLSMHVARYEKDLGHTWYVIHSSANYAGVLLALVAFIIAVMTVNAHFVSLHAILGLIVTILMLVQPMLGVAANKMWKPERAKTPIFPDTIHAWLGRVLLLAGVVQIYLGLDFNAASAIVFVLFSVWIAMLVAFFVFSEIKLGAVHHNQYNGEENARLELY